MSLFHWQRTVTNVRTDEAFQVESLIGTNLIMLTNALVGDVLMVSDADYFYTVAQGRTRLYLMTVYEGK